MASWPRCSFNLVFNRTLGLSSFNLDHPYTKVDPGTRVLDEKQSRQIHIAAIPCIWTYLLYMWTRSPAQLTAFLLRLIRRITSRECLMQHRVGIQKFAYQPEKTVAQPLHSWSVTHADFPAKIYLDGTVASSQPSLHSKKRIKKTRQSSNTSNEQPRP